MMKSKLFHALALAGAMILLSGAAQAATSVFSNLGPKGAFNHADGDYAIGPVFFGFPQMVAVPFTPNATGTLDHLDLALQTYASCCGAYPGGAISLVHDDGGHPPTHGGTALEDWVLAKIIDASSPKPIKTTKITSKKHPTLTAGTVYWVVFMSPTLDANPWWFSNSTGHTDGLLSQDGGTTWFPANSAGAMDVFIQ